MANGNSAARRPLSPHLQIYKPLLTMVMSIVHRITGVALYVGSLLLVWWLVAAATGADYFDYVNALFASIPGRLILLGFTWTLIHHALGGMRHLLWDTGRGFSEKSREGMAKASILIAILLTIAVWVIAYQVKGG